jgi:hypothetical protein
LFRREACLKLARLGSAATARLRQLSGEDRTTFARSEHFSV